MKAGARTRVNHRASGMALVAVLWVVAALSILVSGMAQTVRLQVRVAAGVTDEAVAAAVGDAAVALALQTLQTAPRNQPQALTVPVQYAGLPLEVDVMPLNGLVSLNAAPPVLLAALFEVAGGLPAAQAQPLAQAVAHWRSGRDEGGATQVAARRFEAVEDLLLVPGMDYALYARISPLVTADLRSTSRVNPLAAPLGVLTVLARGDEALAASIMARRAAGAVGVDTSALDPSLISPSSTDFYRLTVRVPFEDGRMLALTRDVALAVYPPRISPWRTLRVQRQILAKGA